MAHHYYGNWGLMDGWVPGRQEAPNDQEVPLADNKVAQLG